MINIEVPTDLPLTHEKHATKVFVVQNEAQDVVGVFPTLERARKYVEDWECAERQDDTTPTVIIRPYADYYRIVIDGQHTYDVKETCYRM